MSVKHTPGPWRWQGEDYRGDWGYQILVGPNGEGLIVGQDPSGGACRELRAYMPVDPSLCITGIFAEDKPHVEAVHVFSEANARIIAAAPDFYAEANALIARHDENARTCNFYKCGCDVCTPFRIILEKIEANES